MPRIVFLIALIHAVALCWTCAVADLLPGQLALQAGDYEQARAEVDAALGNTDNSALRLMQAKISIAENRLADAEQTIAAVLERDPDNAQASTLKGQLYAIKASRSSLFQTGKFARESLRAYETALTLEPNHTEALTGMIRLRASAPALFGGSFKQALAAADVLRNIDPILAELETAAVYKARRDGREHVNVLNRVVRSHPSDPRAWLELGFVEQGKRNWQSAHDHYEAALSAAKDHDEHAITAQSARYQIGRTAVLSKANTELGIDALGDYLEGPAFSELPDYQWAHYRRALLHLQLNRDDLARHDFELAGQTKDRDLQRALRGR